MFNFPLSLGETWKFQPCDKDVVIASCHTLLPMQLPREVRHLHHDHTHLLGKNNDVIARIIPDLDLSIQLALHLLEISDLLGNLFLLCLGQLSHLSLKCGNSI